ncbi:MAG: GDSL-type esterase/lipase family protein [Candidatus Hydrogenedentota bacterium]
MTFGPHAFNSALTRSTVIGILAITFAGCATRAPQFERDPVAALQAVSVATDHDAVTPDSRIIPDRRGGWERRHDQLNDRTAQGGYDLMFIGDSITHFWETFGEEVWNEYYGDRNALNIGISGDRTQHVLWRLENGNIDGIAPKVAVLMIGTNNVSANSAREIADGITAIVQKLNRELPDMKILILGVFPRADVPQDLQDKLKEVNAAISALHDGDRIHYLDISAAFLDDDGTLTVEVMPDLLHPQGHGYKLWAEAMEPTLTDLLEE